MSELSDLNPGAPPLSGGDSAVNPAPVEDLGKLGKQLAVSSAAAAVPPQPTKTTMRTDPDGKKHISIEGPAELAEYYGKAGQFYQQAMGGMQQQVERLKQQEDAARNQPAWVQLATALSANMAQQKDMPGWVKGLGQTAAQLNPRPEQLAAQRLGLMGEQADLAGKEAGLGMQNAQFGLATRREGRLDTEEERKQLEDARKVTEDQTKDVRDMRDKQLAAAQKAEAAPPDVLNKMFIERGVDPKMAAAQTDAITKTNEAAQARIKADRAWQESKEAAKENRLTKALTAKSSDKVEADAALRAVAHSAATGDLMAMRDVSSFRGTDKSRIFKMIKDENPSFDMAEMGRKMKMMDYVTVGKGGDLIQNFGTFLQHGGEAVDAIQNLKLSGSPYLNKSLNWWRQNMQGSPELEALKQPLEAAGIDYERLLIGTSYALQKDDRERIHRFISGDMPVDQMAAAAKSMARIAKDRFMELNHKAKRVLKQDIPDPFSQDAVEGSRKMGIEIPSGEKGGSAPATDEITKAKAAKVGEVVTVKGKKYRILDNKGGIEEVK